MTAENSKWIVSILGSSLASFIRRNFYHLSKVLQKWRVFSSFNLLQNHLFSVKKKKLSRIYSTNSTYSISQQKWDMRISTYNQRQRRETCFIGSIESSLAKRKCHCSNATLEINYWRCHGCLARDGILTGTSF